MVDLKFVLVVAVTVTVARWGETRVKKQKEKFNSN